MANDRVPEHLDKPLLQLYLNDHLAGAAGGRSRAHRMARAYTDLPIQPGLARFAQELDEEFTRLDSLIDELGMVRLWHRQLAAKIGEELGRFKLNGRIVGRSPMTPLLELELLRGAVNGKAGLWQLLEVLAPDLGLDPAEWRALAQQAFDQSALLEELHGMLRSEVFLARDNEVGQGRKEAGLDD